MVNVKRGHKLRNNCEKGFLKIVILQNVNIQ